MGITNDRGRYYFVMRVPKRFKGIVCGKDGKPVSQVRQALHTDSRDEANAKAKQVEAAFLAQWEALAAGDGEAAHKHYTNARKIASAHGFTYRQIDDLNTGDLQELLKRLLSLREGESVKAPEVRSAIMGAVPAVTPNLMEVFEEYRDLTAVDRREKSEAQAKRWEQLRRHAVEVFNKVIFDDPRFSEDPLPVGSITRAHALAYREHWSKRVASGEVTAGAANKHIGMLATIIDTWSKLTDVPLPNPFRGLRLAPGKEGRIPPFSPEWITEKLLAKGAFESLNDEATDVFLMMINTGLRPSEITDAPLSDFEVDAPIPFFRVAPHGRELKVSHTEREIPLLGVSLAAAKRIAARGGIKRYAHKANGWSAAVTKHLRVHGLRETEKHSPYSLRHSMEDALQRVGADDRIRADILGHKYARPKYGDGGALPARLGVLEKVAYPARAEDCVS
ncbi:DUF6538 domain-containing protein [Roseobacter weihaiensis]|uniref:DUF6538 domain-containing protein n=1 Tax=Roseobacter weihaiensis TaxID=2763262 RepID=UPI001D0BA634|nr:DUF6538 domain-containing protein [Roseobacter sp. H9]